MHCVTGTCLVQPFRAAANLSRSVCRARFTRCASRCMRTTQRSEEYHATTHFNTPSIFQHLLALSPLSLLLVRDAFPFHRLRRPFPTSPPKWQRRAAIRAMLMQPGLFREIVRSHYLPCIDLPLCDRANPSARAALPFSSCQSRAIPRRSLPPLTYLPPATEALVLGCLSPPRLFERPVRGCAQGQSASWRSAWTAGSAAD